MKNKTISCFLILVIIFSLFSATTVFADRGSFFDNSIKDGKSNVNSDKLGGVREGELNESKALQGFSDAEKQVAEDRNAVVARTDGNEDALNLAIDGLWDNIRIIISFITGFGTLSSFIIFMVIFMRISALPAHPTQRRKAMEDIVTSGVSTILLGGLTLILTVFYKFFANFLSSGFIFMKDWKVAFAMVLIRYKFLITGILGLGSLTMILMFIKSFMQLTVSSGNPSQRQQAITGLFLTGLATAGMGGITIVVALFTGILK